MLSPKHLKMADGGAARQIRQMVDFIMLEAREKAHEIRTKVEFGARVCHVGLYAAAPARGFGVLADFACAGLFCSPQTEHDFNLEKQMLVTNAKLKMREEFEHKKKELQVQMLMYVAALLWRCFSLELFGVVSPWPRRIFHFGCYKSVFLFVCGAARRPRALVSSAAASSRHETS